MTHSQITINFTAMPDANDDNNYPVGDYLIDDAVISDADAE